MTRHPTRLLLCWAALLGAAPADQPARQQACPPPPPRCSRANAEPATIEAIMADPVGFRGRCVAVTALSHGFLLFTSVEGYYLAGARMGGDPESDPNDRHRLGLDNRKVMKRIREGGLRPVTAIGWVQDCQESRDLVQSSAAPGDIVWIRGFCHSASGPYLWLEDVKPRPGAPAQRLAGEALREKAGDLIRPADDWPHRALVEERARRYLGALRTGDRAALRSLHLPEDLDGDVDESLRLILGRHRGFRDIRLAAGTVQTEIFVEDRPGPESWPSEDVDPANYAATICFCRTRDCAGTWPISTVDADNREDRPYVCTRLSTYRIRGTDRGPVFYTDRSAFGLAEPGRVDGNAANDEKP